MSQRFETTDPNAADMGNPKVSICVPNLNNRKYLPERLTTIFGQSLSDWELIVCDNYSDDGAWEFLQEHAASDSRIQLSQMPREGMYANWNNCIRRAAGEFIYIATSDDTMMPKCLERMVETLEANPDCGICQCKLVIIDETGDPRPEGEQWEHYTLGSYRKELVLRRNKRFAPLDGILHSALLTIYTSITQLLIRKSVFDRIGLFDTCWGSMADFEWGMRVGLTENCVYIPERLATWRIHASQATGDVHTVKARLLMIEMVRCAFARAKSLGAQSLEKVNLSELIYCLERDVLEFGQKNASGYGTKLLFLLQQACLNPRQTLDHLVDRYGTKRWRSASAPTRDEFLNRLIQKAGAFPPEFC